MAILGIIGLQFGDEGKGKVVDYLSNNFDIAARYQGGSNAGHTVVAQNITYKFHMLPSGILQRKISVLGNGMVLDLKQLVKEIESLNDSSIKSLIKISERAHVVMPFHIEMDSREEELKGEFKAGTTKQGIGPTYEDKIGRFGIRMIDLLDFELLKNKIELMYSYKKPYLKNNYDLLAIAKEYYEYGQYFKENIIDTSRFLNDAINKKMNILFEGAQGSHLDIDFGMYPYVTSSNTTAGGIVTGLGVPPRHAKRIMGIIKAYTTKVGTGPFPTELNDEVGALILHKGNEFGTTTGRPRRIGWLDLPLIRYSIMVSGVSSLAMTKIDVLNEIDPVKVCYSYELDGKELFYPPTSVIDIKKVNPNYMEFKGWDLKGNSNNKDLLPKNMKKYINYVQKELKVKIKILSLGKSREDTVSL